MGLRTVRGYRPFLLLLGVSVFQRLKILGVGLILGTVFALFTAGTMMPSSWGIRDRAIVWAYVMGGPLFGTAQMGIIILLTFTNLGWFTDLGWLGLLLIPIHSWRPNAVTACITLLGFSLWFFAGFCWMMGYAWGA